MALILVCLQVVIDYMLKKGNAKLLLSLNKLKQLTDFDNVLVIYLNIKEIYDLLEFYAEKNDQERFTEVNIDFHEAIYRATHSQYFEQLLSDINYYIHVTSRHSIKQPNRLVEAAQEHKEIYDAIVKKDKALAKANVEKHIRKTQSLVRNYYDEKDEAQD